METTIASPHLSQCLVRGDLVHLGLEFKNVMVCGPVAGMWWFVDLTSLLLLLNLKSFEAAPLLVAAGSTGQNFQIRSLPSSIKS